MESPAAARVNVADIKHEGWLTKKAVRTAAKLSWKRRYIRIENGVLSYYKDMKPTTKPKHSLVIEANTRVRVCNYHKQGHELEVYFPPLSVAFYAIAEVSDDILEWVEVIQRVIAARQPPPTPAQLAAQQAAVEAAEKAAKDALAATLADEELRKEKLDALRAADRDYHTAKKASAMSSKRTLVGGAAAEYTSAAATLVVTTPVTTTSSSSSSTATTTTTTTNLTSSPRTPRTPPSRPASSASAVGSGMVGMAPPYNQLVYCWGAGDLGQLGDGKPIGDGVCIPTRTDSLRAKLATMDVAAGISHAAAITFEGKLVVWGGGSEGQLGCGDKLLKLPRPYLHPTFRNQRVFSVACGDTHTLAVVSGGTVWSWGSGAHGQLGLGPAITVAWEPMQITFGNTTLAGSSGGGSTKQQLEPIDKVYAGRFTSGAITATTGTPFMWGSDGNTGRLGLGPISISSITTPAAGNSNSNASLPAPSSLSTNVIRWEPYAVPVLDVLAAAGQRTAYMSLGGVFSSFLVAAPTSDATSSSSSSSSDYILMFCGALGVTRDEFITRREVLSWVHPTGLLASRPIVSHIAAGRAHLVIIADGSVYTMGSGWLGGGPGGDVTDEPIALSELDEETIVQVAAGDSFTLARTIDGRVFAWGEGMAGALCDGTFQSRTKPVQCMELENGKFHVEKVVAGADFAIALAFPGAVAKRRVVAASSSSLSSGISSSGSKRTDEESVAEAQLQAALTAGESNDSTVGGAGGGGAGGGNSTEKLRRSQSLMVRRTSWRTRTKIIENAAEEEASAAVLLAAAMASAAITTTPALPLPLPPVPVALTSKGVALSSSSSSSNNGSGSTASVPTTTINNKSLLNRSSGVNAPATATSPVFATWKQQEAQTIANKRTLMPDTKTVGGHTLKLVASPSSPSSSSGDSVAEV